MIATGNGPSLGIFFSIYSTINIYPKNKTATPVQQCFETFIFSLIAAIPTSMLSIPSDVIKKVCHIINSQYKYKYVFILYQYVIIYRQL